MNYNKEAYPTDLKNLLIEANSIASEITQKLNDKDCPRLCDLYMEMHKTCGANPEYSVIRDKNSFEELGYIPNIKSGKSKSQNEFKGLYVFGEEVDGAIIPIYVGISRTVYRRLRQHGWGKKHNECSLAYLKARFDDNELTRKNVDDKLHLRSKKKIIRSCKVVLIPEAEDYNLYFLEVAIAGILKTKWNSFRTH